MQPYRQTIRRASGFTLLEIVVAFAVLSLMLGILIQIFSRALNTTMLSGIYSQAATVAEARLAAVGVDIPLAPGVYDGDPETGFQWQIEIVPYQTDAGWEPTFEPLLVRARVTWEDNDRIREFVLETLRLGEQL